MSLRTLQVDPKTPPASVTAQAVDCLRAGKIVAMPTETVYGLAVDARQPAALAALNRLKDKPPGSPILLLASDLAQVELVSGPLSETAAALAAAFWPGPLTLVLPAIADLAADVSGGRGTVAIRVPGLALPRALAAGNGFPISGVSANRHGRPPIETAEEAASELGDGLALILDGGPAEGRLPSTVLDLSRERPELLREGLITASRLSDWIEA